MKPKIGDFNLLEKLSAAPGVPGREAPVAKLIRLSLPARNCETSMDAIGNLIAHFPGKGKRVMLTAHMDEVGLIVQRILPNGFLKVERMGGMSLRALPGSRLTLWTKKEQIPAQVVVTPQHLEKDEPLDFSKVFIDAGASSSGEAEEMGVKVGDVLTWDSPLRAYGSTLISGKALDDRLGCFALIKLAKQIDPKDLQCDLFLVFTVQEESMLMGGVPAANMISPEILVGVDGGFAFDTPDLEGEQCDLRLGKGPAVKWMDAIRGKTAAFVPNQQLAEYAIDIAHKNSIPMQDEVVTGMSTAVTPMVFSGKGIPTLALSMPIRYHHTPIETADVRDVEYMVNLLKTMVIKGFQK